MPHSIDASQKNVDKFDMEASEDTTAPGKEGGGEDVTEICQANNNDNNHNNNNNVSGSAGGFDGSCGSSSGGSSSSSGGDGGGSDEDDDGSSDSYRSQNCSPQRKVECQLQTLVKSNGIQMKAKSVENDERCKDLSSENMAEQNDLGGKLSFFLEGRCVLELRHNFNNDGQAKQWVQSFGKTYRPPVASVPTTCIPDSWQPLETLVQEAEKANEEKVVNNSTPTSTPMKKKAFNNFYLTFFARKRCRATSHEAKIGIPHCVQRKAARRPSDVIYKELSCSHDAKCNRSRSEKQVTTDFSQKSQKLSSCIDKLVQLSETKNEKENTAGSSDKLLAVALTQKKENGVYKNVQPHISNNEHNFDMDIQEEQDNKTETRRPLPEWFFDPSKASIPVEEMIGNPRPSLMSPEKCSVNNNNNKRSPEQLNLLSPETKRQAKDDNDKINCDVKSPISSSHRCLPQSKSSLTNTLLGENNGLEKCQSRVINDPSGKTGEIQRKKKKGGGYGRGRTIGEAVRTYVISEILNLGGDVRTNYVPRGVFTEVASRYKIDATTTYRWWLKYCNGIRMAASGNLNQLDASHKGFLLNRITNVPVVVPDNKHKTNKPNKEVNACHPHRLIESSILKREHLMGKAAGIPHGGRYSPRSDDSASSGASLVDPTSLYVSSINLAPHGGVWPANVPLSTVSNSQSHFQSDRMSVPIGVAPYVWNGSTEVSRINGNELKPSSVINLDEPLDLTVPKKEKMESNCSKMETIKVLNTGLGTYSECPSDQYILRTLLSSQGQHPTGFNNLVEKEARYSIGKPFAKSLAQRNMKPKHYTFLSLQIGSFEIHSNLEGSSQRCDRDTFKEIPNKFKVIFTQRKFVYEFETHADMHLPLDECNQKDLQVSAKRMACIVVPFNIVEAFWCYGATIVLRVVSKPFMFLGRKLKQVGCVPSLTVYETKKSVDLTGGQLGMAHLHKVTLIKPHLIEQLKIYLVLFDVRFRNLISPISQSILTAEDRKTTDPSETQN